MKQSNNVSLGTFRKYRLAVVTSHPVQYQAPLFQKLAVHPQIDLTVYYESGFGLLGERDPGFGVPVRWDRPLLDGYRYKFLKNGAEISSYGKSLGDLAIIPEFWHERYDAVFIHSYATLLSLLAYVGAWLTQTPVLLHTESELIRFRRPLMQGIKRIFLGVLFRGTAGFQAIGLHNRAFYRYYGVPESKIYHTPYCVDNEFFSSEAAKWTAQREQLKVGLGFVPNVPVILFSGKLIPRKRPMDLLQAYAGLIEEGMAAGLLFIGEGELRPDLEQFVRKKGLTQVKITGFQNQTELSHYYAVGDVFVLPSEFDPWGLVVNEAMLFSMPVIVSDRVGAGADLVQDGITGYIYPEGDITKLQTLLRLIVSNAALRQRIGHAARALIESWNYDVCVLEILRAIVDVARRKA